MPGLPKLVLHLVWIGNCSYKVFLMTLNVITFIYIYRYVVYVAGQQSEQPKNVQLEPIVKRLNNDIFDQVGQSGKSVVYIKGSDALWQKYHFLCFFLPVHYYDGHQAILLQDPGHPQHPTTLQSGDLNLRKGQGESRKR